MTSVKQQKATQRINTHVISPVCLFDWEAPNQLRCLGCDDHRLLLLLPERRAAMLAFLLTRGQLCGQAKEEAERV